MIFKPTIKSSPESIISWAEHCIRLLREDRAQAEEKARRGERLRHFPIGTPLDEIVNYYQSCEAEINFSAILFLMSWVEATIRIDTKNRISDTKDNSALAKALRQLCKGYDITWKIPLEEGILRTWQDIARKNYQTAECDRLISSIGDIKACFDFRHWVAHGRYWPLKNNASCEIYFVKRAIDKFMLKSGAFLMTLNSRPIAN